MSSSRVIGYCRVSTPGQAQEGVSLAAQEARIKAWCEYHGHEFQEPLYQDAGISGHKADNRPQLQRALAEVCRVRGRILVVYSLSRLARSTMDTINIADRLAKAGADLASLTEQIDTTTASGKMLFRLLAVLAEFERDLVSERTCSALQHLRANGHKYCAHDPYGWEAHGNMFVAVPAEQEAIRKMREMHGQGFAFGRVAAWLTEHDVPTKRGGVWRSGTIIRILQRSAEFERAMEGAENANHG